MIHEEIKTLDEAFKRAPSLAARITSDLFKPPMELEFEKVYVGFILFSKKRYIGMKYEENNVEKGKLDAKGVEMVRRDNCNLLSDTLEECCKYIFKENEPQKAEEYVKTVLQNLYLRKISLKDLLITRSLSRETSDYANKQPHAELVERMRTRPPEDIIGSIPQVGDRVMYVMVAQGTGLVADKAEDPLYVLEHDIPYDVDYYVENQLKEPLSRLLTPVIGESRVQALFNGEHTRKVVKKTSALVKNGVFSTFFTQTYTCTLCGTKNCKQMICDGCKKRKRNENDEYEKLKREQASALEDYQKVYRSCQKCQGHDGEVICLARDCSQLYDRVEKQKACEEKSKKLKDIEDLLL